MFKVRVLYDFQGEPGTAEIGISAGEILNVKRTDVGEGWWEGVNSRNQSGLFPEAYVEKITSASQPPSMPAPVLPNSQSKTEWRDSQADDDWDDDWDDETYAEIPNNYPQEKNVYGNDSNNQHQFNDPFSIGGYNNMQHDNVSMSGSQMGMGIDNKGTVSKKSLNIFSSYVKSGLEGYILGKYYTIVFNLVSN